MIPGWLAYLLWGTLVVTILGGWFCLAVTIRDKIVEAEVRKRFVSWVRGERLVKLAALEAEIGRLCAQIDRDFPGEFTTWHPFDYDEQRVIVTAGILLGRYHGYQAGGDAKGCDKPLDQPTFAPFRQPDWRNRTKV